MKRHCSRIRGQASVVLILAALCPAILLAVPGLAADPVRVLTLDEALQITLEHNRDIQKAVENKKKIMGFYVEQRAAALPQLTATGTGARSWDEAQAQAQTVGPFSFGARHDPGRCFSPEYGSEGQGWASARPFLRGDRWALP